MGSPAHSTGPAPSSGAGNSTTTPTTCTHPARSTWWWPCKYKSKCKNKVQSEWSAFSINQPTNIPVHVKPDKPNQKQTRTLAVSHQCAIAVATATATTATRCVVVVCCCRCCRCCCCRGNNCECTKHKPECRVPHPWRRCARSRTRPVVGRVGGIRSLVTTSQMPIFNGKHQVDKQPATRLEECCGLVGRVQLHFFHGSISVTTNNNNNNNNKQQQSHQRKFKHSNNMNRKNRQMPLTFPFPLSLPSR